MYDLNQNNVTQEMFLLISADTILLNLNQMNKTFTYLLD